jgi:hypothetical protein
VFRGALCWRRLLTTTDCRAAGIARIKSSYLVQVAFYTFLLQKDAPAMPASATDCSRAISSANSIALHKPSLPPSPRSNASIQQRHSTASN